MKAKFVRSGLLAVVWLVVLLVLSHQPVLAATFTITSSTSWSAISGGPPTSTDDIVVRSGATLTVDVANAVCRSIQLGGTTSGSGSGTLLFNNGSQVTISGTVTVGGGTSTRTGSIDMTNGGTLIAQSLAVNNAGTWTPGTGTVVLTANNTIPNTFFTTFNNLTINGGTTTLGASKTLSGDLTVSAGTLDLATFTANRSAAGGTLTVSNGATLRIGGTNSIPSNYDTHSIGGTSTVEYAGANQSVVVLNSAQNYGNLVISGTGTKTLAGNIGVASDLTINSATFDLVGSTANRTASGGTLTIADGATLRIGGTNTFPTNYTTHSLGTASTVEYNGTAQSISAEAYGNLILSGSGNKTFSNASTTIANAFTKSGGTMVPGTGTVIFTGASGSIAGSGSNAKVFYNLQINNGASISQAAGTGSVTINGSFTNNGTFTQDSSITTSFGGTGTQPLSGGGVTTFGNVTVQGGSTTNAGLHNFSVSGTFSVSSGGTFNGGTATVTFTGSSSSMGSGQGTYNFNNVTISGTLSNSTNNRSFNVAGNWTNNGTYTPGTETITFNGSAAQTIGGTATTTFANLTISNTSGVSLGYNETVTGTLALTSGNLTTGTGTNQFTLGSGAAVTAAGGGDVIGDVVRGAFSTGTGYAFNNPNTAVTFGVTSTLPITLTINLDKTKPSQLTTAVTRTYTITPSNSNAFSATLSLRYANSEKSGMTESHLALWRSDGTRFFLQGGTDTTDATNPYVALSGVTAFSPWAITDNGEGNPTAVTLSSFNGGTGVTPNDFVIPVLGFTGGLVVFGGAWFMRQRRRAHMDRPAEDSPAGEDETNRDFAKLVK